MFSTAMRNNHTRYESSLILGTFQASSGATALPMHSSARQLILLKIGANYTEITPGYLRACV